MAKAGIVGAGVDGAGRPTFNRELHSDRRANPAPEHLVAIGAQAGRMSWAVILVKVCAPHATGRRPFSARKRRPAAVAVTIQRTHVGVQVPARQPAGGLIRACINAG